MTLRTTGTSRNILCWLRFHKFIINYKHGEYGCERDCNYPVTDDRLGDWWLKIIVWRSN